MGRVFGAPCRLVTTLASIVCQHPDRRESCWRSSCSPQWDGFLMHGSTPVTTPTSIACLDPDNGELFWRSCCSPLWDGLVVHQGRLVTALASIGRQYTNNGESCWRSCCSPQWDEFVLYCGRPITTVQSPASILTIVSNVFAVAAARSGTSLWYTWILRKIFYNFLQWNSLFAVTWIAI
jgi:hypothetical protein